MNNVCEDIKDILIADSNLALTFATDLFIGEEPPDPDDCVTIFDYPGAPPELTLDNDSNITRPSFQIRVRNRDYTIGYILASNIMNLLHGLHNEVWNGTLYMAIFCQNEPALLDYQNGNARFIMNFNLLRR